MSRVVIVAIAIGLFAGLACGSSGDDNAGGSDDGALCEHGTYSDCACPDGSMGMQLCAHDTSGFEPCMCGGAETSGGAETTMSTTAGSEGVSTSGNDAGTGTTGTSAADSGESTSAPATSSDGGTIGSPPVAMINHPGTEDRQAGVDIPFVGVANDAEDGMLSGASMVWTDSLEGEIGQGESFSAALNQLGQHTVTLTATDSDGNIGEDSITFDIVP